MLLLRGGGDDGVILQLSKLAFGFFSQFGVVILDPAKFLISQFVEIDKSVSRA